jgi:hypothetical protein
LWIWALATEGLTASRLKAADLAPVLPRFFDLLGGVPLVWVRLAWSPARKGFFPWPKNFDFL